MRPLRSTPVGSVTAEPSRSRSPNAQVVKYPAIVACAAVAAGMLGVGGGMVLGPIFLELDLLPEVSRPRRIVYLRLICACNVRARRATNSSRRGVQRC